MLARGSSGGKYPSGTCGLNQRGHSTFGYKNINSSLLLAYHERDPLPYSRGCAFHVLGILGLQNRHKIKVKKTKKQNWITYSMHMQNKRLERNLGKWNLKQNTYKDQVCSPHKRKGPWEAAFLGLGQQDIVTRVDTMTASGHLIMGTNFSGWCSLQWSRSFDTRLL